MPGSCVHPGPVYPKSWVGPEDTWDLGYFEPWEYPGPAHTPCAYPRPGCARVGNTRAPANHKTASLIHDSTTAKLSYAEHEQARVCTSEHARVKTGMPLGPLAHWRRGTFAQGTGWSPNS